MASSNKRIIVERVVVLLKALGLTGIADANIVACDAVPPNDDAIKCILGDTYPGILVTSFEAESIDQTGPSPVGFDDIGYPVLIGIFASKCGDAPSVSDDTQALWREQIRQSFIRQQLLAADSSVIAWTCTVEPRIAVDPQFRRQFETWASVLVLRFHVRESRS